MKSYLLFLGQTLGLLCCIVVGVVELQHYLHRYQQAQVFASYHQQLAQLAQQDTTNLLGDDLRFAAFDDLVSEIEKNIADANLFEEDSQYLRSFAYLQQGDYQQARQLLPSEQSVEQLYSQGTIDLWQAVELRENDGDMSHAQQLVDQSIETYSLASSIPNSSSSQIEANLAVAYYLQKLFRIESLLETFLPILRLFETYELRRQEVLNTLGYATDLLKDRQTDSTAVAICRDSLIGSISRIQQDLADLAIILSHSRLIVRQKLFNCFSGSCTDLDQFVSQVRNALQDIGISLYAYSETFQTVIDVAEREDEQALIGLCAGNVSSDKRFEMLYDGIEGLDALEEMFTAPGSAKSIEKPDDLEEFKQHMEEYIPEERDEYMIDLIRDRSNKRRQRAVESVQDEGYNYSVELMELFEDFYGEVE